MADKIRSAENIILYSDSDLDGVTSALILKKTLAEIGKSSTCFFTDRERRGYGLNRESVDMILHKAPGLLIAMDCGISNFEGVEYAKDKGFDVFILDHHKPHEKIPKADLIVCPKLFDDDFKERPNAGIIMELSELILKKKRADFIEYTAIAIIADMMIQENVNAEILFEARQNFPATEAVKVFSGLIGESDPLEVYRRISSIMNVTEIISGTPESFHFFLIEEKDHLKTMGKKLISDYEERKKQVEKIKKEIMQEAGGSSIIFIGSNEWPSHLLGKIASKVLNDLDKPVFLYKDKGEVCQGTVRVPKGVDAVEAMKVSENILENYGGHPPAAGFTLKKENLDEFKNNLIEYFK